jgi:hypothetical protein
MRSLYVLVTAVCLLCPVTNPVADGIVDPLHAEAALEQGSLRVVLHSGAFSLIEGPEGQTIEMKGFDYLKEPGRPILPEKQLLILLPPGARARSLEVQELDARRLPRKFTIAPTPPLLPLPGSPHSSGAMKRSLTEWEETYDAAYSDDRAYPGEVARIVGSGSLRKFSYVRVAFHPFTYHALSGRLFHHDRVRIRIRYELPRPIGATARHTEGLLRDTVADARAAELFVNYHELKQLYQPEEREGAPRRGEPGHHDYVIITTAGNVDAITASSFPAWKSSLGLDVRIVLTTDPEVAEQPGSDLAQRIRNFLRANYIPWGIEYVLLVGGYADVPMRYCYPDPENHVHNPADPGVGPGSVPTDAYYADLSFSDAESWDLDGDGFHGEYGQDNPDFLTEVNVGRIPTSHNARITYTLDKLAYVESDSGAWKRNALHAGAILFYENQDSSGIPLRDGAVCVDEIETHFMQDWTMSRYSEQSGLVPSSYPWPALTLQSFLGAWNSGDYGIVNWAGHGWPDQVARVVWSWDDGDGVPETDGSDGMYSDSFITDPISLQVHHPSIVCAVSCDVGYPEPNAYGNLGINLLTHPGMGAAAGVMSSSRYAVVTRDWPALPGGAESLCYEFNRYLIAGPDGPRKLGAAVQESKFFSHLNYGWESDYEYRNLYNYNLYGDPAMDWRGAGPRTGDLLRSTDVSQLDPLAPPLSECFPWDPVEDLHVADFVAGSVDPDPAGESPLVFYAIDAPVRIWLAKRPSGEIQIDF